MTSGYKFYDYMPNIYDQDRKIFKTLDHIVYDYKSYFL